MKTLRMSLTKDYVSQPKLVVKPTIRCKLFFNSNQAKTGTLNTFSSWFGKGLLKVKIMTMADLTIEPGSISKK